MGSTQSLDSSELLRENPCSSRFDMSGTTKAAISSRRSMGRYKHRDVLVMEQRAYFEALIAETVEEEDHHWQWEFRQDGTKERKY